MSRTISISTCTNQNEAPYIFKSVYSNFLENVNGIVVTREKWLTPKEIKSYNKNEIIVTSLSSGNKYQVLLDIKEGDLSFHLNNIINSKEKIIARIPLKINDNYEIGIDIEIYGEHFENGFSIQNEGYIRATFNFNDLQRPLNDIVKLKNLYSDEELIHDEEYRLAVKLSNDTFEKIFQTIAFSRQKVNHCIGYIESGVPLPMFSSSMYHANHRDYILDLWRNYIGYFYDIEPLELYSINDEYIFLEKLEYLKPIIRNDYYYQELNSEFPDAIKFISEIKIDKLRYISKLSNFEIKELIESTNLFLERDVLNHNVEVKIVKEIFMVYGMPTGNIWKFYETLYNLI